jgi:hypothetical protein
VSTYRRVSKDVAEVEKIVGLIDAHLASNIVKWAQDGAIGEMSEWLELQRKWSGMRDSLRVEPGTIPLGVQHPTRVNEGAFTDAPPKEVPASDPALTQALKDSVTKRTGGDRKATEPK